MSTMMANVKQDSGEHIFAPERDLTAGEPGSASSQFNAILKDDVLAQKRFVAEKEGLADKATTDPQDNVIPQPTLDDLRQDFGKSQILADEANANSPVNITIDIKNNNNSDAKSDSRNTSKGGNNPLEGETAQPANPDNLSVADREALNTLSQALEKLSNQVQIDAILEKLKEADEHRKAESDALLTKVDLVVANTRQTVQNVFNVNGPWIGGNNSGNISSGDNNQNLGDNAKQNVNHSEGGSNILDIEGDVRDVSIDQNPSTKATHEDSNSDYTDLEIEDINALFEEAEGQLRDIAGNPIASEDLANAANDAADAVKPVKKISPPVKKPIDKPISGTSNVPLKPVAGTPDPEDSSDKPKSDLTDNAEKLTGPLTPEKKKELEEAGTEKGFLFTIKRAFKGEGWKRWVTGAVGAVGGSLGMKALAGVAIASGPAGMAILGAGIVGLGIYTGIKSWLNIKHVADQEGKTVGELVKDKDVRNGLLIGGATALAFKGVAFFVPGLSILFPVIGGESLVKFFAEKHLNKKQSELVQRYMDEFELRRYKALKDKGYVIRGEDGAPAVSVESILKDMNEASLTINERKTARKAAIATLMHLYSQTKDDAHKFISYTVKENGVDVKKKIDITQLSLKQTDASTPDYQTLQLFNNDPKINLESIIDTLSTDELKATIQDAWSKTDKTQRENLAKDIVTKFVGLEAGDVDEILSESRQDYLKYLHITTGFHTGAGFVNAVSAIAGGTKLFSQAFHTEASAAGASTSTSPDQDKYRQQLQDPDAKVSSGHTDTGAPIDQVDLHGDGTPDLYFDHSNNHYIIVSESGAEHVFQLQHPEIGTVVSHAIPNTDTQGGIMGTLTDASGKVVGFSYTDGHTVGVMPVTELSGSLHAVDTNGVTQNFAISGIQANGDAVFTMNGVENHINLAHLGTIAGATEIATNGTEIGSLSVSNGDSMNSMLHHVIDQAKTLNPNLPADNTKLEELMYTKPGGPVVNDLKLAHELGLPGSDSGRPAIRPGQDFDWSKSPTIMAWLQELNGGQEINLGSTTSGGGVGNDTNLSFNGSPLPLIPNELYMDGTPVPASGSGLFTNLATGAALIGAGLLAAFNNKQVGGITRKNDPLTGKAVVDDKKKTDGIERSAEVSATNNESKEVRINQTREVILKQVLPNVEDGLMIQINNVYYKRHTTNINQWIIVTSTDGKSENAIATDKSKTSEEITDILLKLDSEKRIKDLEMILDRKVHDKTKIKVDLENKKDSTFSKQVTQNNGTVVVWDQDSTEHLTSFEVAIIIFSLKEKIIKVEVPKTPATPPEDGADSGGSESEEGDKEAEKSTTYRNTLKSILTTVTTIPVAEDVKTPRLLNIGKDQYKFNKATGIWVLQNKKNPDDFTNDQLLDVLLKLDAQQSEIAIIQLLSQCKKDQTISFKGKYKNSKTTEADPNKWTKGKNNHSDKTLAKEIMKFKPDDATDSAEATNADGSKPEADKSKEKMSLGRKILKAAIITVAVVGTVAGSVLAAGSGAGLAFAFGGAAVAGVSFITRVLSERSASNLLKEQNKIYEDKKEIGLTKQDKEKIEELKKKEKLARTVSQVAKAALIYSSLFGGLTGALTIFGPTINSIEIVAKLKGLFNWINVTPVTSPIDSTIELP